MFCVVFSGKLTSIFLLTSILPGLDLMSLLTPGLQWVGEICTDLAMVIMNPIKATEIVMMVAMRTHTGIALTLMKVETRAGLAGIRLSPEQK